MRYQNQQAFTPWKSKFVAMKDRESIHRDKIYAAIIDYASEHGGNSPTIREIQAVTAISSTSVVAYNVHALVRLGKLEIVDRKLIVVGATWQPPPSGAANVDGD